MGDERLPFEKGDGTRHVRRKTGGFQNFQSLLGFGVLQMDAGENGGRDGIVGLLFMDFLAQGLGLGGLSMLQEEP